MRVARLPEDGGARVVGERHLNAAQEARIVPHVEAFHDKGTLVHDPLARLESAAAESADDELAGEGTSRVGGPVGHDDED